jgi:hypothetical protein
MERVPAMTFSVPPRPGRREWIGLAVLALALLRGVRAGGIVEEAGAEADDRSGGEVEAEAAA